jgi:hypothetical protein
LGGQVFGIMSVSDTAVKVFEDYLDMVSVYLFEFFRIPPNSFDDSDIGVG